MKNSFALVLLLSACGPDVTAWKGTWAGSGSINTGRQPIAFTGNLVISDGAHFVATSDAQGTPSISLSCALNAATADGTTVTFTGPQTLQVTATPADGCTRTVTLDAASATRTGEALEATANGKLKTDCTGGSSTAESFLLTLAANRK